MSCTHFFWSSAEKTGGGRCSEFCCSPLPLDSRLLFASPRTPRPARREPVPRARVFDPPPSGAAVCC